VELERRQTDVMREVIRAKFNGAEFEEEARRNGFAVAGRSQQLGRCVVRPAASCLVIKGRDCRI
jgi:hypothetical protein